MENKNNVKNTAGKDNPKYYIKITEDGPYLLYGIPMISQEIIVQDEDGDSWSYQKGKVFKCEKDPCALCRCGQSDNKPFCDGRHKKVSWDPQETASKEPIMRKAQAIDGPSLVLYDNKEYCAYARFCDAYGNVWNLVELATSEDDKKLIQHEVSHCPAGRLMLYDKQKKKFYEPKFDPSVAIIEDPILKISGPIWVRGGIRIESADGSSYEVRNRVTLCRCGNSSNKPFCDASHVASHFNDHLINQDELIEEYF